MLNIPVWKSCWPPESENFLDPSMRDLLPDLTAWQLAGKQAALATVIGTWGSSPRPVGAHMAISEDGNFCGSVSGGCVESTVIQESQEVIHTGEAKRLSYGVSNETAWEVGLACGGQMEIFLTRIEWPSLQPLLERIQSNQPAWYTITLDQGGKIAMIPPPEDSHRLPFLDEQVHPATFTDVVQPPRQLVIFGGVNLAQPLVTLAKTLGFITIVVDPRRAFASRDRFPDADRILHIWPQDALDQIDLSTSTAVAVLSHDDKIDLPALEISLLSPAFYVGALGSRQTQARRKQLLADSGLDAPSLARIKGPIGFDLGGRSPAEIALAILAEIISISR